MKKGIITLVGCGLFALLVAFSNGSPAEATGAPDEQTCGNSSCHNVDPNTGDAILKLEIDGTTETYEADATYTLKVLLEDAQSAKNGFQIVALDAENNNAGTWTITDANAMQERDGNTLGDRKYVTHTSNGNRQAEWSLDWTAPSSDVGAITFYISSIDSNDNGTKSGDNLYTISSSLDFSTINSVESFASKRIALYPNPSTDFITIENVASDVLQVRIYNISGQLVRQQALFGQRIDVQTLEAGVYFLQLETKTERIHKQFLVQ